MPLSKLVLKPGINRDQTSYASEGGWYECDKIRFRSGFPEKIGGWTVKSTNQYDGVCRSIFPYATSTSVPLLGVSTNSKNYAALNSGGTTLYDITPLRLIKSTTATDNCFWTTNGSNTVLVKINNNDSNIGDYVTFSGAAAVGGITTLNENYEIKAVVYSNATYSIASTTATITRNNHNLANGDIVQINFTAASGGTAPPAGEYAVSNVATNTFDVTITSGSGTGSAIITTVTAANIFAIQTASNATSTVNGGGGTSIVANFEIHVGNATGSVGALFGWGTGTWGTSGWGLSSSTGVAIPARLVFQDRYLDTLYFNIQDATGVSLYDDDGTNIFYWDYDSTFSTRAKRLGATYSITSTTATITVPNNFIGGDTVVLSFLASSGAPPTDGTYTVLSSPAPTATTFAVTISSGSGAGSVEVEDLTSVPQRVGQILFAPSGHLLALGCTDIVGNYDPLLIRWSNVDPVSGPQPEIWYPTVLNTAGDLRVSSGSRIVTGYKTRQEILIFTDFSLNSLQFLGTVEVFGLQELASDISIMGPNVVFSANNTVFWMGVDKFYFYNGRVDTLPCTLRQYIFDDINTDLASTFVCGGNAQFNEIIWFYASKNSNTLNRYVIYNYQDQIWYYGTLDRTYWTDAGYVNNPLAASEGWIYEHENGTDDGQPNQGTPLPIDSYIISGDIDLNPDGDKFLLIRKLIPDINFNSSTTTYSGQEVAPQAYIRVEKRDFPGEAVSTVNVEGQSLQRNVDTEESNGVVYIDQYTNQIFLRARARQMRFTIGSNTLGTQWQLGMPRFEAREDGRRGGNNGIA